MKIVLLSGGSGKRLWPLSNDTRSKQFLKVLRSPEGRMESMVQRVWRQLERANLAEGALVAIGAKQQEIIRSQLPETVATIVEPSRRDTFPAIALAAASLYTAGTRLDEVVAILPVDPYVNDDFFLKVRELEDVIRNSNAELALIGVQPTYPSAKYGYIVPDFDEAGEDAGYKPVRRFVEKPDEKEAESLIAGGALWNCGVFAFRLESVIRLLVQRGLPIHDDEMIRQYDRLPKISFDYEVVEKSSSVVVTPYEGDWKDLGTWNTLTEEMNIPIIGRGIVSPDSVNTHVVNELDLLVTVIGLSDVVIAASPDGILVADKARSPQLKEMLKDIEQRPMYEEKRWGTTRIMDCKRLADGSEMLTRSVRLNAGQCTSYHFHLNRDEYWTVVSGTGTLVLNHVVSTIRAGDTIRIPAGEPHSIKADSAMEWIEVQMGSRVSADDVIRLYYHWAEIKRHCGIS